MADRVCPKCGAVPGPRLRFCRECGARVDDAPDSEGADGGDETIMGPAARRPPADPPAEDAEDAEDSEDTGDATIVTGALRRPPGVAPTPPPGSGSDVDMKTMVGTTPPAWLNAPSSAPPDLREGDGDEPVSDEVDLNDDDSGSTILASAPPPLLGEPRKPAPTPPPPPAPPQPPPVPANVRIGDSPLGTTGSHPPTGSPGTVPGPFKLEHWSPRQKTELLGFEKGEVLVGRDRGDLTYSDDNFLSKKHARFFRGPDGRLMVEDMGTLNGTYRRVRVPEKLQHRDTIYIGRHVFRFELLKFEERDDRTMEGDPLTKVQGIQGTAPRARIVKRQDEGFCGLPFCFGVQKYVLGRTDGTHNFGRDDRMSRRHTSIWFQEGDYWIEDLGSQNGTYLRVRGPTPLDTGDVILVGEQFFKVV